MLGLNPIGSGPVGGGPGSSGLFSLVAESGVFSLTGASVGIALARELIAESGSFGVTGADLSTGLRLPALSGSFAMTGYDATITYIPIVTGVPGPYSESRNLNIPAENRLLVCGTRDPGANMQTGDFWNMSNPKKPKGIKDPDATIDIVFDWADWLADAGDAYASHTLAVTGGLIIVATGQEAGRIAVFVKGGTVGHTATLTCHIVTDNTPPRIEERTVYLKIEQR